jgi:hypothetical protein
MVCPAKQRYLQRGQKIEIERADRLRKIVKQTDSSQFVPARNGLPRKVENLQKAREHKEEQERQRKEQGRLAKTRREQQKQWEEQQREWVKEQREREKQQREVDESKSDKSNCCVRNGLVRELEKSTERVKDTGDKVKEAPQEREGEG